MCARSPRGDQLARVASRLVDASELPMPADQLVRVIHCLIEGLVMQRILTPDLCPDDVFYAAFGAFAHHRREPNRNATPAAEAPGVGTGPASD